MIISRIIKLISFLQYCISCILLLASSLNYYFCFEHVKESFQWLDLTSCFLCSSSDFICFSLCSSIVSICFSNPLPSGEYLSLACSIILLWSDGNISSPLRNSYLSIFPDDNANIFPAFLLILYSSLFCHQLPWFNFIFFLKQSC